jgi:hypothetical protein
LSLGLPGAADSWLRDVGGRLSARRERKNSLLWAELFSISQRVLDQFLKLFVEAFGDFIDLRGFESAEDA